MRAGLEVKMLGPVIGDLKSARRKRERLLEFVNNCQHAPYPEGRSCDFDGGVPTHGNYGEEQWLINEKKGTAKPQPGSDAWLDAHNISREVFLDRPYHRFEQGDTFDSLPPEIQALYEGEPEGVRQVNKAMAQSGGYIMSRRAVPGSPESGVVPQLRPDVPIVTDKGAEARALRQWQRAQARAEDIAGRGPDGIVDLQKERVEGAKKRLEEAKVATRETYLAYATNRVAEAETSKENAKNAYLEATGATSITAANRIAASGNASEAVLQAKDDYNAAQKEATKAGRTMKDMTKDADFKFGPNGERTEQYRAVATANGEKVLAQTEKKLAKYEAADAAGREAYFKEEVERANEVAQEAKEKYEAIPAKYVFPPNPSRLEREIARGEVLGKAGRVNAHMEENVRRLVEGKGRVYLAMEGCMKEDSLLTAVMAEGDETSAVISVPSVTLWRNNDMKTIAQKYLRGREVVLIPDADGVNNPRVLNEGRAMQSMLESLGAKVVVAPPPIPLIDGKPIVDPKNEKKVLLFEETIKGSPLGTKEELKGVDDYLGVGRGHGEAKGTLGNLAIQNREIPLDKLNLRDTSVSIHGAMGTGIATQALPNAQKALNALSNILGPVGSGRVGTTLLESAMGEFHHNGTTAKRALGHLADDGHIRIEYVFDPDELAMGRRVQHPDMTNERLEQLVKSGVIERPSFGPDDTRPVELGMKETPIITLHKQYRAVDSAPTPLSSLPSSKSNITKTRIKSLQAGGKTLEEIADLLDVSVSFLRGKIK